MKAKIAKIKEQARTDKETERSTAADHPRGQIDEYNDRIQHNELLKELEGKTQARLTE
ncbi:hypothetical protein [Sporomusa sphaeroides]|uniref:hypothetical protein n=1 Tax=Sporomusa sphaeroides TaxID=47679 RepID=UPI003157F9D5